MKKRVGSAHFVDLEGDCMVLVAEVVPEVVLAGEEREAEEGDAVVELFTERRDGWDTEDGLIW